MEYSDLQQLGLTERQEKALRLVTREPGITYFDFIRRIKDSWNIIAQAVKLADIGDNSSRLAQLPKDVAIGLRKRYDKAKKILELPVI